MKSLIFLSFLVGFLISFFEANSSFAAATLSTGFVAAAPGSTVLVPVNLVSDTNVAALNLDLLYDSNYLSPGTLEAGPALTGQSFLNNIRSPGDYALLIYTFTYAPLSNGTILYIPFTVAANAPDTNEMLTFTNYLLLSDASLDEVNPVTAPTGTLAVTFPPAFTGVAISNQNSLHLTLSGVTNRDYVIQAATNLSGAPQWLPIATNTATNGAIQFDETINAALPARYYRAAVAP